MVFKQIKSGFSKFFTPNKVFILVVFLVLAYALMSYSNTKSWDRMDYMTNASDLVSPAASVDPTNPNAALQAIIPPAAPPAAPSASSGVSNPLYTPGASTNPADLLPSDSNSEWASLNPAFSNNGIVTPDLLQAGALSGLDTIGQTMKNPNLQIRSDPVIPKQNVGPWQNSTIEPDLIRAPFEINSGAR